MSTQSKKMPTFDLKSYVRIVAAVFIVSSSSALGLVLVRLIHPNLFYGQKLVGSNLVVHYLISALMVVSSTIGFLNSCIMFKRIGANNSPSITTWLLLDSLFETSRVVYIFVCEVVLNGNGILQCYELIVSAVQYLTDSFFYCQMILRH